MKRIMLNVIKKSILIKKIQFKLKYIFLCYQKLKLDESSIRFTTKYLNIYTRVLIINDKSQVKLHIILNCAFNKIEIISGAQSFIF